jgi:hypothetical protein
MICYYNQTKALADHIIAAFPLHSRWCVLSRALGAVSTPVHLSILMSLWISGPTVPSALLPYTSTNSVQTTTEGVVRETR